MGFRTNSWLMASRYDFRLVTSIYIDSIPQCLGVLSFLLVFITFSLIRLILRSQSITRQHQLFLELIWQYLPDSRGKLLFKGRSFGCFSPGGFAAR